MISTLGGIVRAIVGRQSLPEHTCLFYREEGYRVGAVNLDLILEENHEKNARVTENPMQDGRAVSDGIYLELRNGTLTGLVSNHSIKYAAKASKQLDDQTPEALTDLAQGYELENRASKAWEDLKAVMDARDLVTIVCSLEVYENVAITNITAPRDGESGDAQEFAITFREVKKVQLREDKVTAQVQPTDMASDINRLAAVGTSNGQQVGSEPTAAEREQLILGVQ